MGGAGRIGVVGVLSRAGPQRGEPARQKQMLFKGSAGSIKRQAVKRRHCSGAAGSASVQLDEGTIDLLGIVPHLERGACAQRCSAVCGRCYPPPLSAEVFAQWPRATRTRARKMLAQLVEVCARCWC